MWVLFSCKSYANEKAKQIHALHLKRDTVNIWNPINEEIRLEEQHILHETPLSMYNDLLDILRDEYNYNLREIAHQEYLNRQQESDLEAERKADSVMTVFNLSQKK